MYRSASWNRFSDDYYSNPSPSPAPPSKAGQALRLSLSFDGNELPTHDPVAEMVKREKARVKFAENAVHVIPLVLLLCAVLLWFFSNPEIDVVMRGEAMAARIEGLTIEGDIENEIDGTQAEVLPIFDTTHSSKQPHHPSILKIKRLM